MLDLVTPGVGPLVSEGPVATGIAPAGQWSLELAFRLGVARRMRLLAHIGVPGAADAWCAGLDGRQPFVECSAERGRRHWRGTPLTEGVHVMRLLGDGVVVTDVTIDGVPASVEAAGRMLPAGVGPFADVHGLQLGGVRDRAGGHVDLRFGLDAGDDLLAARYVEGARPAASLGPLPRMVDERASLTAAHDPGASTVTVFHSGEAGYAGFRIPGLLLLPSGRLLAVAEGRWESLSDSCPTKDLVIKHSDDGGVTWSSPRVVMQGSALGDGSTGSVMNPSLLHDGMLGTNRTLVVFTALQGTEWDAAAGRTRGTLRVSESDDDGWSWSPSRPLLHEADDRPGDVAAFGPAFANATPTLPVPSLGHGVQIERGPATGRMLSYGNVTYEGHSVFSSVLHGYESDDAGRTWRRGPSVTEDEGGGVAVGLNEASIALIDGEDLMLSVRSYERDEPTGERAWVRGCVTSEGDLHWTPVRRGTGLTAPAVHGSIVACVHGDDPARLASCHPSHPRERRDLDVVTTTVEGDVVGTARVRSGFAAYSDVAFDPTCDDVLVLFESSLEGDLAFARVSTPRGMEGPR